MSEQYSKTKVQLEQLQSEVNDFKWQLQYQQQVYASLVQSQAKNTEVFNDRFKQLQTLKTKEHVVIAKPTLVEKKIDTSFQLYQRDIECATGNKVACQ